MGKIKKECKLCNKLVRELYRLPNVLVCKRCYNIEQTKIK